MCWYCNKLKIKTAKKDIPVWKIVQCSICDPDRCYSLYAKFPYIKSIIETTSIGFEVTKQDGIFKGTKGFHSYSNKLKWEKDDTIIFVLRKKTLFRSQNYIIGVPDQYDIKIAKFYIPKGYKYAENENGEIISSAIVFGNFIE